MKHANTLKTFLSLLLCAALLLSLAACSGKPDPGADASAPANPSDPFDEPEGETRPPIVSRELGLNEGKFYIYHEFVFEEQKDVPLFICDGADTAEITGDIRLRIADERSRDLFTIVLRVPMETAPVENQNVFMVSLYFTHDDRYLLGVIPQKTDKEAFYYYDNVKGTFSFVGRAEEIRFLGKTFLLRELYAGETERSEVRVYDKNCNPLGTYPELYDMEVYERTFYCLQGSDPAILSALSVDRFFEDDPELAPDELCRFPGYSARFGLADYGRVTLIKTDGSDLRLLTLSEALVYANELAAAPAEGNAPIAENCDLFSVTLPGMFADKYVCEKTESEMLFYEKAAKEAGAGGFLFGFACLTPEKALDIAADNNRLVYCRYLKGDEERYIAVQLPTGEPENVYLDEFVPLRDARPEVTASLTAAAGAEMKDFDYSDLVGKKYAGETAGGDYELEFTSAESYELAAALRFTPKEGEPQETSLYILLLQTGKLTFLQNDTVYYGELAPEGAGWLLTLGGEAGTWLNAPAPILLK